MQMHHNGLSLSRVGKTFRAGTRHARTALEDVSLQLAPAQVGVLLGPSGCGKTTLLRLVAGFLAPDRGRIELHGKAVTGDRLLVPAEPAPYTHLTAADE